MNELKYGIIVGYNRPASLKRLIDSVLNAHYGSEQVDLVISVDKSTNQNQVVDAVKSCVWKYGELKLIVREARMGLRKHILSCGDLVEQYDAIVVLEDDLVVSPFFFDYVKETVSKYAKCEHIGGISLYKHETHPGVHRPFIPDFNGFDAYLMQFAQSWGQCWTRVMWQDFKKWYEKNEKADLGRDLLLPSYIANWNSQSWLKYYMRYLVETNKYFVYPYISLSTNASDIGEHNKNANNDFQVALLSGRKEYNLPDFENAIRYDVYFERQNIEDQIFNEYKGKKIIDLYGQKKDFSDADYLISTQALPYRVELSFQIKFRPHEQNCFRLEAGKDAFLYNLRVNDKKTTVNELGLIRYDVRAISWKRLLRLGAHGFSAAIKIKLTNIIKKVSNYSKNS